MANVTLNSEQEQLVADLDEDLELSLSNGIVREGTEVPLDIPIPGMAGYPDLQAGAQGIRQIFRLLIGTFLARADGLTIVVDFKKADDSPGTMTFVNGILTETT